MDQSRDTARVALVTGSSRGIGLATARRLAHEGYTLALAAIGDGELHQAAAEIDAISQAFAVEVDLSDAKAIPPLVEEVVARTAGWTSLSTMQARRAEVRSANFRSRTGWTGSQ